MEEVKKGQLVFEYVGEVIDDDELEVRHTHVTSHSTCHSRSVQGPS